MANPAGTFRILQNLCVISAVSKCLDNLEPMSHLLKTFQEQNKRLSSTCEEGKGST